MVASHPFSGSNYDTFGRMPQPSATDILFNHTIVTITIVILGPCWTSRYISEMDWVLFRLTCPTTTSPALLVFMTVIMPHTSLSYPHHHHIIINHYSSLSLRNIRNSVGLVAHTSFVQHGVQPAGMRVQEGQSCSQCNHRNGLLQQQTIR